MATGLVRCYDRRSGYGFIVPDDGGKDLYVHRTNTVGMPERTLIEGERVEFERRIDDVGTEAVDVLPAGARGEVG